MSERHEKQRSANVRSQSAKGNRIDGGVLRLAKTLAAARRIKVGEVLVPRAVAAAGRDLERARALARRAMQGDRTAAEQFAAKIGGSGPLPKGHQFPRRPLSLRASALMAGAQAGPVAGIPCLGQVHADLELIHAAFKLDAELGYRDARLTRRAGDFVRERRDQLAAFERDDWRPKAASTGGRGRVDVGDLGRTPQGGRGELPPGTDRPVPDGFGPNSGPGRLPPGDSVPLLPPDANLPGVGDPLEPPHDEDFCLDISDVCLQLYQDFAAAALAEDDAQLIASVGPNCLCAADLTDNTEFTAWPDPGQFPADRDDYSLLFRGADITDRIISWQPDAIRFTIPAGSRTGYVELRRPINTGSRAIGGTLANLCGFPDLGGGGQLPSPSPRAIISIIHRPVVESFTVNGAGGPVAAEACTAVWLNWAVRLEHQQLGALLPPCCTIQVEVRDAAGDVLHRSSDEIGGWNDNPVDDIRYRIVATSMAGNHACGTDQSGWIDVGREHRLYVEPGEPASASIVAAKPGTLMIRLSCPAPAAGALVMLSSSNRDVLHVPNTVTVLPGERSAIVQFATSRARFGRVAITARLANHHDGVLDYEVVENLTAIVLSGGGAKGSFEVGALLYLREIWNEITPRIICGTSVGAINALGLAEATHSGGVDKIERIWLGLQFNTDMYVPSLELQRASEILEVPIADILLRGKSFGGFGDLYLNLIEVTPEAAAWAATGLVVAGQVGALVGGLAQVFIDEPADKVDDAVQELKRANYLLDLTPTQDKITATDGSGIDLDGIASSGMKLRLATVALEDGKLYYVTEASRLIRGNARRLEFDEPITATGVHPLVDGAMASSAIPVFFQPRRISTVTTSMFHVDGGVREVLPSQVAVELGAQLLFTIAAGPSAPSMAKLSVNAEVAGSSNPLLGTPGRSFGDPGRLFEIGQRGIDLAVNEVLSEERLPRAGFCDDRERVLIQPSFEVHDTIEIDPGLIRINMAYGFFRAFDADQFRRGNLNVIQYYLWQLWTDDLIRTRGECHAVEMNGEMRYARGTRLFHHNTLQAIRERKNHIAELIETRFDTFGAAAFPRQFVSAVMGNHSVLSWCDTWEIHQDPHRSFLNGIDLWQPQMLEYPMWVEDGTSYPAILEPTVLGKYPLPVGMRDGLLLR